MCLVVIKHDLSSKSYITIIISLGCSRQAVSEDLYHIFLKVEMLTHSLPKSNTPRLISAFKHRKPMII
ncbi:hypothetical protein BJX96DRAFT_155913 [Aspergillus floccosus]